MFWWKRKLTKADRVERALRMSGRRGVSNWNLNKITFRYGAVIYKLRDRGYEIDTIKVKNNGLYMYYYRGKRS